MGDAEKGKTYENSNVPKEAVRVFGGGDGYGFVYGLQFRPDGAE